MKWFFIVFFVYLASLFFRPQPLPGKWVEGLCERYLPTNVVVHCAQASIGFRDGLRFDDVSVYDMTRRNNLEPVARLETAAVSFLQRRVRLVALEVPRINDSYYYPELKPPYDPASETNGFDFASVELPRIPDFDLELERPKNVLGIAAESVTAMVVFGKRRVSLRDIRLDWPDLDHAMHLDGVLEMDFSSALLTGEVHGHATQRHIRPLMVALDLPVTYPYFDSFTEVQGPVPASCAWKVLLRTGEFWLDLDLHPKMGRYAEVSLAKLDGKIGLHVWFPCGGMDYANRIGPLVAIDRKGRRLEGSVTIVGTNCTNYVDFDAKSAIPVKDLFAIGGVFRDGTLDCFEDTVPPLATISGRLATDVEHHQGDNDAGGDIVAPEGRIFGFPFRDARCGYSIRGSEISFTNVVARGADGGRIAGEAHIVSPLWRGDMATFSAIADYSDGSLEELARSFGFDEQGRSGKAKAHVEIAGPVSSNLLQRSAGKMSFSVRDGHLAQLKLFAGMTEMLADRVPGVGAIVNQSQASADFTLAGGKLKSNNVLVEGAVFSIKAAGEYDIAADRLNFRGTVRFLKDESFLSKLTRPVFWAFNTLLMEFTVGGSVSDPQWKYVNIVDKAVELGRETTEIFE